MPRVSREQTDLNHDLIEQASARLFRERGIGGVSVAELMAAAGLSHGGFYGHFESKDALAAAACRRAFSESAARWRKHAKSGADDRARLAAIVDNYLSSKHRDQPGAGCAAVALATDVAREPAGKPVRAAYADGVRELVDTLAALRPEAAPSSGTTASTDAALLADAAPLPDTGKPAPDARHRAALVQVATLVGALTLARATEGDALSDDILAAVRAHFQNPASDGDPA